MTRVRVLVMLRGCLILVLLFQGSAAFETKSAYACHSTDDCGHAQLFCNAETRLAILRVTHAHHLNTSFFDQCPASVQNCSAVTDECCKPIGLVTCSEDYPSDTGVLAEALRNCSAVVSHDNDNVTCDLGLPPFPQQAEGGCSGAFQNLSSFSAVNYTCVDESDIMEFCTKSTKVGRALYAFWDTRQAILNTTCQCRVTPGSGAAIDVTAIDVRIPKADVSERCSGVTITESGRTLLTTNCSDETSLSFHTTSQSDNAVTPVDVILSLHTSHLPDIVWIQFTSKFGKSDVGLNLTCYEAGVVPKDSRTQSDDGGGFPVAATVAVTVVVVVILFIGGFICSHYLSKRKGQSASMERRNWWERTREEDRIAELSQLGHASKVIVDNGRHMRYGKHPTYRRRYPTGEDNPPIYFVSGSAVERDPDSMPAEAETEIDGFDVLSQQRTMPVFRHSGNGTVRGRPLEPRVIFSPATGPEQVVILTGEPPPVRTYDIPPLTIREIE